MRRFLALPAVLGFALAALPASQSGSPIDELQQRHLLVVRAERTTSFHELARVAAPESRRAAAAFLAKREQGRPSGKRPSLEELALAQRILEGGDPQQVEGDALARFVDSLDLEVVPGALEPPSAAGDPRGMPLTVHLYRLHEAPIQGEVTLSLVWVAPDGTETLARREPFAVSAFRPLGTRMYVRAPTSREGGLRPGLWHLVPEAQRGGRSVRGAPVPVECTASLAGGAVSAALLERGARPLRRAPAARGQGMVPARPWTEGPLDPTLRAWILEGEEASWVLVLVVPQGTASASSFTGRGGTELHALALERGFTVVSLEMAAGDGPALAAGLEALGTAGRRIVLAARGDAVTRVVVAAARHALALDVLLLLANEVPLPPSLAHVPTLVASRVRPNEGSAAKRRNLVWLEVAEATTFMVEPTLASLIASEHVMRWTRGWGEDERGR